MLDCRDAGLEHVPDKIPDTAVVIDLSSNFLGGELNNDSFSNCINVKKLYLSYTVISVVWNVML